MPVHAHVCHSCRCKLGAFGGTSELGDTGGRGCRGRVYLRGVHDLLPDVHLPEALEKAEDGRVQPLPAVFTIPLRMRPRVHHP